MKIYNKNREKVILAINPFISEVDENVDVNLSGLYSIAKKDANFNAGLFARVDGDAKNNIGGLFGLVGGNAKNNIGGLFAVVDGDAKCNIAGLAAGVGGLKDYKIRDIFPRITKYLPKRLQNINLPSINAGIYTNTKKIENGFILGLYNDIKLENSEDYLSVGVLNRVKNQEGKAKYNFLFSGNITLDGILSHKENNSESGGVRE